MTVQTTPAQEGIWHWYSPTEVHYRPEGRTGRPAPRSQYKLQTGGLPMGDGWYGRSDLTVDLKVGPAVVMTVDNKTKRMTVTKDGKVIKTIPVSLGKKTTPSSSGTMVVIEKQRKTVFDTHGRAGPGRGLPHQDRLRAAAHLGRRVHPRRALVGGRSRAASTSRTAASTCRWRTARGCSARPAIGDPITVKGTERKLQNGNGWTDWNMSWDQYVKGSALPEA